MKDWLAKLVVALMCIYAVIAGIGYCADWRSCNDSGGEYMRTVLGKWKCIQP